MGGPVELVPVAPMLAKAGALPTGAGAAAWAFEMKWDGIRAVAYAQGGELRLVTRNDRDIASGYPELLADLPAVTAGGVVLDGEIVSLDAGGRPSFERLQQRMHLTRPAPELVAAVPVRYFAFDVLQVGELSTLALAYDQRRELLESLELPGPTWLAPPAFAGAGEAAIEASRARGLEGVVAKRRDSPYVPGRRTDSWIKVKLLRTTDVVVGGWRPGEGRRAGLLGSLLVGVPDEGGLAYLGRVGTGFTDAALRSLGDLLRDDRVEAPPFVGPLPRMETKDAVWVRPRLVGEVTYAELTSVGRLRHPSWRGLRPDRGPADVTWPLGP